MFKSRNLIACIISTLLTSVIVSGCGSRSLSSLDLSTSDTFTSATDILENQSGSGNISLPESSAEASTIENFILSSYRKIFNEYDLNHSGTIEPSELKEAPDSFNLMDKDKNKKLTFTEVTPTNDRIRQMSKWINGFYNSVYKEVDSDGNGFVSPLEMDSSDTLEPFKNLNYWNTTVGSLLKTGKDKTVSFQMFVTMMNNLFLDLQRSFENYKVPKLSISTNRLPIVLVQGYGEPSWYFLYGIYHDLKKNGWNSIYPVNLFPNITDIKEQARIIAKKIEQAKKEQGVSRVDYVCHSMGGLIGRYYIQELRGENNIDHFVSIATPHYGTYTAWLGIGEAANQMRPGSSFLTKLNAGNPIYGNIKYTSIWSKTDEIVIPAESAQLLGSMVKPDIKYVGHFFIMWNKESYKQIKDSLIN